MNEEQLLILKDELLVDATVDYTGMDDATAKDAVNLADISRNITSMSGKEVKDFIVTTDWDSRTIDQQQILLALFARDDLDPHGIDAHIFTEAMSGAAGSTIADLNAARTELVSRATIRGLPEVSEGAVSHARRI